MKIKVFIPPNKRREYEVFIFRDLESDKRRFSLSASVPDSQTDNHDVVNVAFIPAQSIESIYYPSTTIHHSSFAFLIRFRGVWRYSKQKSQHDWLVYDEIFEILADSLPPGEDDFVLATDSTISFPKQLHSNDYSGSSNTIINNLRLYCSITIENRR